MVSALPKPMLLKSMLVLFTKSALIVLLPVAAKSTAEAGIQGIRSGTAEYGVESPAEGGTRSKRTTPLFVMVPSWV